jgi:hypothetical protein
MNHDSHRNLPDRYQVDETVGKVEAALGRTRRKTAESVTRVGKAVKR